MEHSPVEQMNKYIRVLKRLNRIFVGQCGKNEKIKIIADKLRNGLEKAFVKHMNRM